MLISSSGKERSPGIEGKKKRSRKEKKRSYFTNINYT